MVVGTAAVQEDQRGHVAGCRGAGGAERRGMQRRAVVAAVRELLRYAEQVKVSGGTRAVEAGGAATVLGWVPAKFLLTSCCFPGGMVQVLPR